MDVTKVSDEKNRKLYVEQFEKYGRIFSPARFLKWFIANIN